jgi:hypothetical protein
MTTPNTIQAAAEIFAQFAEEFDTMLTSDLDRNPIIVFTRHSLQAPMSSSVRVSFEPHGNTVLMTIYATAYDGRTRHDTAFGVATGKMIINNMLNFISIEM